MSEELTKRRQEALHSLTGDVSYDLSDSEGMSSSDEEAAAEENEEEEEEEQEGDQQQEAAAMET